MKTAGKNILVFFICSFIFLLVPFGREGVVYGAEPLSPPVAVGITANTITLELKQNYKYRMDNGEWTDNNVFTGLQKQTAYTFYQRLGDDETTESLGIIIVTSDHNHEWIISAQGNVIKAECRNSDENHIGNTESTLTLNKPAMTVYGGSESNLATISGTIENVPLPEIVYENRDTNIQLNAAPSDAGNFRAMITVGGAEAYIDYTINRKQITVKANDNYKYKGDKDPELTAYADGIVGNDPISCTLSREEGEEPGTYVITPTGNEIQGNYIVSFEPGTFTIVEPESEEEEEEDDPEEEDPPEPTPEPEPSPAPTPAPGPAPSPTPAPTPTPVPEPEDPVIPSPDLGVRIPEVFRLLRSAGVKNVISGNQIVLYAPRKSVSFNGRSHIKEGSYSSRKKTADLDIRVENIPEILMEKYHYKNNRNASARACYYISLAVNKSSSDYQALSSTDRSSLKKAVRSVNKSLKDQRVYFTINKLDLSEFVYDSASSKKGKVVFRRKSNPNDTMTIKNETMGYIEDWVVKEKKAKGIRAVIEGTSFKLARSEYSKSRANGEVIYTGTGNNLIGSMTKTIDQTP